MRKKPTNKQFATIFDAVAPRYDQILNQYAVSRRIEFIKKFAKGKCLEVGAGSGTISKILSLNHQVVATDISVQMIKVIKNKLKIKALVCDAEKLPFKTGSFETIIASEMIYYLDNPEKFFQEAKRILRPQGRLLISAAANISEGYDKIRSILRKIGFAAMYFDDQHQKLISLKRLNKLLKANGFAIKKLERTIVLPFKFFDSVNRILENSPLRFLGSFIFIYAGKNNND